MTCVFIMTFTTPAWVCRCSLGQAGQVAGHAGQQAAVALAQPPLRLPHQDRVDLEEEVGGEPVALVGGQEQVEVEVL